MFDKDGPISGLDRWVLGQLRTVGTTGMQQKWVFISEHSVYQNTVPEQN